MDQAKSVEVSRKVKEILEHFMKSSKLIGIICASVMVIAGLDSFKHCSITSHPCIREKFAGWDYIEESVVVSNNLVTSRGPGTAFEFSLKLVEIAFGKEKMDAVRKPMMATQ